MTNYFADDGPQRWTLADVYDDLCGSADVPKVLDVSPFRVVRWIHRRERIKCPYPIKRIGASDVYSKQEWKDWYAGWTKKHKPGTKWTDESKPHGTGTAFWDYFDE